MITNSFIIERSIPIMEEDIAQEYGNITLYKEHKARRPL